MRNPETQRVDVSMVFEFWRDLLAPSSRLDDRRRKLIAARLDDGYSVEDLQLACLGCRASPFHMGDNDRHTKYCSIDLICRSSEYVDKFISIAEEKARVTAGAITNEVIEKARGPIPDAVRERIQTLLKIFPRKNALPHT